MNRAKRERRYQRRKAAREAKKEAKLRQYDDFEQALSIANLIKAASTARRNVGWKSSVQRYMSELLFQSAATHRKLMNDEDIRKGFYSFSVRERGKVRHIKSLRFSERVVHKAYTVNALYPIFTNSLIYDNYASQKGKGVALALKRMKLFLQEHFRKYGREGGILLIDLKNYFGSINHKVLLEIYEKEFKDKRLVELGRRFVEAYGDVGLGLGSETCQINAVKFLDRIDHLIKDKLGIRGYGRYMDDSGVIHKSIEFLKGLMGLLKKEYAKMGITLNEAKTKICDLKHGFVFLKTQFYLTETGKVIMKPCRESVTRARQRIKGQARLVGRGVITYREARGSYYSSRSALLGRPSSKRRKGKGVKKNSYRTVMGMDRLFGNLYKDYQTERSAA